MTHDVLMAVDVQERRNVFAKLTPENKSALKRAHAEAWLAANRHGLSAKQIAVVQKEMGFLSPELHRDPHNAVMRTKAAQIRRELECALDRRDRIAALTFLGLSPAPILSERLDEWLNYFGECVAGIRYRGWGDAAA